MLKFSLLMLLLATVPGAFAQSTAVSIDYGRSWPRSIVVDSARSTVYVDAVSGMYPPAGFSFGVINASTHAVDSVLPLNVEAGRMALDPASGDVYVAGSKSIAVMDGRTRTFVRQIDMGVPVFYLLFDGGSGNLFFTDGLHGVFEVDPTTGGVVGQAAVGSGAEGLAVDPAGEKLFVANYLSCSISVLRVPELTKAATIQLPAPCYPSEVALSPKTGLLYSTTGLNTLDVVDAKTDTLVHSFTVAPLASNSTFAIAIDYDTSSVFVLTAPGTTVTQVDGTTGGVVGRFTVGSAAYQLAVDQATGELYVTVYHQISVFTPLQSQTNGVPQEVIPVAVAVAVAVVVVAVVWDLRARQKTGSRRREA